MTSGRSCRLKFAPDIEGSDSIYTPKVRTTTALESKFLFNQDIKEQKEEHVESEEHNNSLHEIVEQPSFALHP